MDTIIKTLILTLVVCLLIFGCSANDGSYVMDIRATGIDSEGQSVRPPEGLYCMCKDPNKVEYHDLLICKQATGKVYAMPKPDRQVYDFFCTTTKRRNKE